MSQFTTTPTVVEGFQITVANYANGEDTDYPEWITAITDMGLIHKEGSADTQAYCVTTDGYGSHIVYVDDWITIPVSGEAVPPVIDDPTFSDGFDEVEP